MFVLIFFRILGKKVFILSDFCRLLSLEPANLLADRKEMVFEMS